MEALQEKEMKVAIDIVQFGWAKGKEMSINKRNKNCDGFQHFASNGQNLGHYAKAKAKQKRKKLRAILL